MKLSILVFIFFMASLVSAQTDSTFIQFKVNADIASRYIWRGSDYFNSAAIQPDMELIYKDKIGIGAWGSFSFSNQPIQENDLFVFANIHHFSIYVYDYFYMNQIANNAYFNYDSKKTGHTLSADLSYKISENFPLTILASYNFWGNDTMHSQYFEISYQFEKHPVQIFMGATTDKGWYGNSLGVVNTGIQLSREIKVSEQLSIPFDIQCIVNPQKENIYLVAIFHL